MQIQGVRTPSECVTEKGKACEYKCEQTRKHICWNKTEIRYKTWKENDKSSQYKTRCLNGCQVYNQGIGIIRCLQSVIYISSSVYNINVRFQFCYYLCQRTPIATCSRRIPYYAYHTCQSGSYWNWLVGDIVHSLSGSCTYPGPRPQMPGADPGPYY